MSLLHTTLLYVRCGWANRLVRIAMIVAIVLIIYTPFLFWSAIRAMPDTEWYQWYQPWAQVAVLILDLIVMRNFLGWETTIISYRLTMADLVAKKGQMSQDRSRVVFSFDPTVVAGHRLAERDYWSKHEKKAPSG